MRPARTLTIVFLFVMFHILVNLFATQVIPAGFFPYQDDLIQTGLPHYLYSLANFDGAQYLKIAQYGYLPLTQAFFPLYPILIRITTAAIGSSYILSGLVISILSFFGILVLLSKYLRQLSFKKNEISWFLIFFIAFPTSFFFISLYSESIFLLVFLGALVAIRKKQYFIAGLCGVALGLTRVTGIFLMIPLFMDLLHQYALFKKDKKDAHLQSLLQFKKNILVLLSPAIGFVLYGLFLHFTTGDFLAFFHLQPISNATRSTELILLPQVLYRYFRIFFTATPNFQYFIAMVEFATISSFGLLILYDLWKIMRGSLENYYTRIGLHGFSLAVLILPTLTGTLSSLPRYALPLISIYYVLAQLKSMWLKISILIVFSILHVVLFAYFVQGYFVS